MPLLKKLQEAEAPLMNCLSDEALPVCDSFFSLTTKCASFSPNYSKVALYAVTVCMVSDALSDIFLT